MISVCHFMCQDLVSIDSDIQYVNKNKKLSLIVIYLN